MHTTTELLENAKKLYDSYVNGDNPCFGEIPRKDVFIVTKDFAMYAPYIPLQLTPIIDIQTKKKRTPIYDIKTGKLINV
jgi:hypothetical protein